MSSARHYFAYAPEHDYQAYLRWLHENGLPWVEWRPVGPTVLRDHDLIFPVFDAALDGGRASVGPLPGKRVAGMTYAVPAASVPSLNRFVAAVHGGGASSADVAGWRHAAAHRTTDAAEYAVAFYATPAQGGRHVPPTREYLRELVEFAHRLGHSHGWTMHLLSIATTAGAAEPILYDI